MSLQEPISISSLKSQRKMKNSQDHLYTDKHPTKQSYFACKRQHGMEYATCELFYRQ